MLNIYVTGVEQNSNKIYVTSGLAATMQSLGYSTGIYKPVEIGAIEKDGFLQSEDLIFIKVIDPFIKTYFSYLLKDNSTPLFSAAKEEIIIDKNLLLQHFQTINNKNEVLITDGVFGLATPYSKNFIEEDVIKMFDMPVIFTASADNNSINTILLSINRAKETKIDVRGIIINNFDENNSQTKLMPKLVEEYTDAKVIGTLPILTKDVNPNDLIKEVLNGIDIEKVFDIKIAKLS